MRLKEIAPAAYAREVLPLTAPLWAGRRSFDVYVAQTLEIARSAYGKRNYRTVGLYDGDRLVSSFKRYERTLHLGEQELRAIGFGAVFTPAAFRGRGYASVMLATELDRARSDGVEVAYLFSDIRPQFYAPFGFSALASRNFTLRASALEARRVQPRRLDAQDWSGIRRCFAHTNQRRSAGFIRDRSAWGWIGLRVRQDSEHSEGHPHHLVLRRNGVVCAYVLGARVPERDAYVLDEYGFADDEWAETIGALVRAAAGDLRRITGWVPPDHCAELPKGTTRRRARSTLMLAPLGGAGPRLVAAAQQGSAFCWATEHI